MAGWSYRAQENNCKRQTASSRRCSQQSSQGGFEQVYSAKGHALLHIPTQQAGPHSVALFPHLIAPCAFPFSRHQVVEMVSKAPEVLKLLLPAVVSANWLLLLFCSICLKWQQKQLARQHHLIQARASLAQASLCQRSSPLELNTICFGQTPEHKYILRVKNSIIHLEERGVQTHGSKLSKTRKCYSASLFFFAASNLQIKVDLLARK